MKHKNILAENMRRFRTIGIANESEETAHGDFPHEIKSEKYWRQVLSMVTHKSTRDYAVNVLNTVMNKQSGRASDRQMMILDRARRGDTAPWHTKN